MKNTIRPMQFTIFFGIVCGLAFIPLHIALSSVVSRTLAFRLILWGYLVLYVLFLTQWRQEKLKLIILPLLLLLITSMSTSTGNIFFLLYLGVFSWIRSCVCVPTSLLRMLLAEGLLSAGGGILIAFFAPHSLLLWALAIWLFWLVQSLYFVFEDDTKSIQGHVQEFDAFEQASRQVERILSSV